MSCREQLDEEHQKVVSLEGTLESLQGLREEQAQRVIARLVRRRFLRQKLFSLASLVREVKGKEVVNLKTRNMVSTLVF